MGQRDDLMPMLRGVSHVWAFWSRWPRRSRSSRSRPAGAARGAALVYGSGMCVLFAGSAMFHRLRCGPRLRSLLCRIDHSAIFVFIAASYTPVALLVLDGPTAGRCSPPPGPARSAASRSASPGSARRGCCSPAPTSRSAGSRARVPELVSGCRSRRCCCSPAGGLLYSAGAVIYALRRPDPWPRIFGFHEVFHALVIAAAAMHFVAMAGWIIPAG